MIASSPAVKAAGREENTSSSPQTDSPERMGAAMIDLINATHSAKIITIAELEKQTILGTITQLNGDKLMAARLLGIGKTTLYRKLKEYASQD